MSDEPRIDGDGVAAAASAFRALVERFQQDRRLSDAEVRLLISQWLADSIQKMVAVEWRPMLPPETVHARARDTGRME